MYSSSADSAAARTVFDRMDPEKKNEIAWTSMINGYIKNQSPREALQLFALMEREGVEVDAVTMATVISACGEVKDVGYGKKLHARIRRSRMRVCVVLGTALVDMYAKCGELELGRKVFDDIPDKNVVCWSAMIPGYAQNSHGAEALALFREMVADSEPKPNEITIMAALSACAQTGDLALGRWIHAYIDKADIGNDRSTGLMNSLIDMYSKCGKIELAVEVFDAMPTKDIVSWNAMIIGLALHRHGDRALVQFESMQEAGIPPDDITFIGVLSACSHGGLVNDSFRHFRRMKEKYGIEAKVEHYGCMADLLSRAGMLEEAAKLMSEMPMAPNAAVWGALLAGCRVHDNAKLWGLAAKRLVDIEPNNDGHYVLLSNIFARKKQWEEVRRVRLLMHERGIRKTPGFSSIVVNGASHEFTVGSCCSHPESDDIPAMLDAVNEELRAAGYVADTTEVLLNIAEEEKAGSLSQHSEKLAVSFGLLKTSPGDEILILKNLRVCSDCHSAFKLISKLFQRKITVRDRSRFHHFENGACSCKDYW